MRSARPGRSGSSTWPGRISPQYLSEVERGAKDPSSEVLRAVSGALDLPAAEVVRRASTLMASPARRQGPTVSAPTALRLAA